MGRKKSYCREELLEKALDIFRIHGFAGTSTQMLAENLGLNKFSLYAEFSNKQGLFEAVLKLYNDKIVERNFTPLESPDSGIEEIKSLLTFFKNAIDSPVSGKGCLFCNSAVEFGANDPTGTSFIKNYFKKISQAYLKSLSNAKSSGRVIESIDLNESSDYLTATTLGLFVMIRAKAPAIIVKNSVKEAKRYLDTICI
jgi:TetR/AcrR family transcriptional regulator, transcriptional repressor for nem operon